MTEPIQPNDFFIQLSYRVWVIWGYGPRSPQFPDAGHAEPALVVIEHSTPAGRVFRHEFPFKLSEGWAGGAPPQEHERRLAWGWRANDGGTVQTSWHIAATRELALEDARAWARWEDARSYDVRHGLREPLENALNDVRAWGAK